ncbi:helix-turn-helix domain-containing protein [Candidatus Micrarchaeota archaeon]|nr:helix-turn-helix domain-containing protein [Candidatus Micrarchaeota archaeon]
MEKIKLNIAGEISLSDNAGQTMKKWREIFGISQVELAKHMHISVSTISDYEANRRKSPGTAVVKRFVNAIFELDMSKGGQIGQKLIEGEKSSEDYFTVHEFARGISIREFAKLVDGRILTNEDMVEGKQIYGYTLIDSLKVILEMPFSYFPKMYGNITERAFIFTGVSSGRSPMVVIRVSASKPSVVVLHGIGEVDKLALKISERERIPLIITALDIKKIKENLEKI